MTPEFRGFFFYVLILLISITLSVGTRLVVAAETSSSDALFSGKTIRIIVGYSPGGGFDTVTRLFARHLSRNLPGTPSVLVSNMPGAGGAIAFNTVYSGVKADGLTWATADGSLVLSRILGLPGPEFEVDKYPWLGVAQADHQVCMVMTRTGIKTADEFLRSKKPVLIASTIQGDSVHIRPALAAEAVNANFKIILGYKGTSDMRRAMEVGEADAACWGWESMRITGADMLRTKQGLPILQLGFERHPDLPNVPNILDFPMSDNAKAMLRLVVGPGEIAKLFAVPPGVPSDGLKALRQGFANTLKDPKLLSEAEKANIRFSYVSPEQVTKIVGEMLSTPAELKDKVAKLARPG